MKKYLMSYIEEIDNLLTKNKNIDYEKLCNDHLIKISFFQHERLIHLLVTLFYALFTFIFIFLAFVFPLFAIIAFILIIFLIFYVVHYFRLENGVQYMYKQYDIMKKKID